MGSGSIRQAVPLGRRGAGYLHQCPVDALEPAVRIVSDGDRPGWIRGGCVAD